MSKLIEGKIQCPFYIMEGEKYIACEGVLNGTKCEHRFKTDFEKRGYEENVCSSCGGKNCPHYKTIALLYERGIRV